MVADKVNTKARKLLSYVIASADLYYSEANQRNIYVQTEDGACFRVWTEITELGEISAANLCEVFLEYSLNCQALGDLAAKQDCMQEFAEILGQRLAHFIKDRLCPAENRGDVPYCAMCCILDSMNVDFIVEETQDQLLFRLEDCPLHSTAASSGLPDIELAHYGIGVLCDSVMRNLDPALSVHVPVKTEEEHIFIVNLPS